MFPSLRRLASYDMALCESLDFSGPRRALRLNLNFLGAMVRPYILTSPSQYPNAAWRLDLGFLEVGCDLVFDVDVSGGYNMALCLGLGFSTS